MSMRREALRIVHELGWGIFPVFEPRDDGSCTCPKPDCANAGKHPRTQNGWKRASRDVEQIKRWWDLWPKANLGYATNECLVLDVDGRQGEKDLAKLERKHGEFPRTVEAETSKGRHIYFRVRDFMPSKTHVLGSQQLDSRGAGGYVLLSPSVHKSGHVYTWRRSPFDHEVAGAPAWLERMLREEKKSKHSRLNGNDTGRGVSFAGDRGQTRSEEDVCRLLSAVRRGEATTRSELRALLWKTSPKARDEGDHYIERTIDWVLSVFRATPTTWTRCKVESAFAKRFARNTTQPPMTQVKCVLRPGRTIDGRIRYVGAPIDWTFPIPSKHHDGAVFRAALPGVSPREIHRRVPNVVGDIRDFFGELIDVELDEHRQVRRARAVKEVRP